MTFYLREKRMQQVNLLSQLERNLVSFPAIKMLWVVVLSILILALLSGGLIIKDFYNYYELDNAKTAKQSAIHEFNRLARLYPLLAKDKSPETTLDLLNKRFEEKKRIYNLVTQVPLMQGFSDYMVAFSKANPPGATLRRLFISQGVGNIALKGVAINPVTVSKLVANLYHSPLFKNRIFKVYALDDKDARVHFEVATEHFRYRDKDKDASQSENVN